MTLLDVAPSTTHAIRDWSLNLDANAVLRGQGIDPALVRRPRIVAIAERAVELGRDLIEPQVAYRVFPIEAVRHQRLELSGGKPLVSALLAEQLAPAQQLVVIVGTIGARLERSAAELMRSDPALGLALDAYGSAAVEALSEAMCNRLEEEARARQWQASVPLGPGMIDWPVESGQPQIFQLVNANLIGLTLNDSAQMIPYKSSSMVLGLGPRSFEAGRTCDFCALRDTCRYQNRAAHQVQ